MPTLIQVPIFKSRGDVLGSRGVEGAAQADMSLVDLLDEYTTQYWQELIPSFLGQLHSMGLLNRKRRFTRSAHIFLDGLWRPGRYLLEPVLENKLYRTSPSYELTTRLCAAGAVLQKTELFCLLGKKPTTNGRLEKISALRDVYIASRIQRVLSADPDSVGILILGAGHPRIAVRPPVEVKVYHRAELWPRRFLQEFFGKNAQLPLCQPDDFGHEAGYVEPAIVNI